MALKYRPSNTRIPSIRMRLGTDCFFQKEKGSLAVSKNKPFLYSKKSCNYLLSTIMDKSLGTNLQLWCFSTRAKQAVAPEFIYTCLFSPPYSPPLATMLDTSTRYFSRVSTLHWGGGGGGGWEATYFKTDYSAFLKHRKLIQSHKCPKEFCPSL